MTEEKFRESLISSGFRECPAGDGYTLYERDGNYIFAYQDYIAESSTGCGWKYSYSDIRLVRSRKGWFEIEMADGSSLTLEKEDEMEIGCMG